MRNLQDCFQRKRQLTVNTRKKRDAGLSDSEGKCGILLCCSAELGHRGRHEKETAAGKISMRAIIKNINWRLPSFLYSGRAGMYQHSQSEGAAWHQR